MKVSRLIKLLKLCQKQAGDVDVVMVDPSGEADDIKIQGCFWNESMIVIADGPTMDALFSGGE